MPIQPHPDVPEPQEDLRLWRYTSLAKYLDLLSRGSLWLSRADLLGDPFEGHFTNAMIGKAKEHWAAEGLPDDMPVDDRGNINPVILRNMGANAAKIIFVSCWHSNDFESAALWAQYAGEGVAISTTLSRLRAAVETAELPLHVARVSYIDFDNDGWSSPNMFTNVLHKRRSFEHEREVRLLALHADPDMEEQRAGLHVDADLAALIDRVHVHPEASDWYRDVVVAATRAFGLDVEVVTSRLADRPVG